MTPPDRPVWRSRAWLVACAVLVVAAFALLAVGADGPGAVIVPVLVVATAIGVTTWTLIRARQRRLDYEARLTTWAAEHATHHERLRIARELHDIVSHGLGVITLRASAARRVRGDVREAEREQALIDIEQASRDAVTELRRMLAVLRDTDERGAPLRPVRNLSDLPAIVEATRPLGLEPQLTVGELGDVSPGVQATVCEIVREAVANTARYAGPTLTRVDLRRDGDAIVVTVEDDGPRGDWSPSRGAGHGLAGLRERVGVLGGELRAAPAGTGFQLIARLPDGAW
ncbi:histidine kinase [Amycolatopsis orientalis]|uniref:histidine kinase n=1 Tax=Amycolatopsis orientalis TaxID=31958 RepID=A0A193C011_AMYOR|nr:histidine kinase [Amycolatopsis orientalis]ANN17807.1 histidine kinase [Amycolatopsis orientalis]